MTAEKISSFSIDFECCRFFVFCAVHLDASLLFGVTIASGSMKLTQWHMKNRWAIWSTTINLLPNLLLGSSEMGGLFYYWLQFFFSFLDIWPFSYDLICNALIVIFNVTILLALLHSKLKSLLSFFLSFHNYLHFFSQWELEHIHGADFRE